MQDKKENINILIVDDKLENLLTLEAILEAPNRTFIRATSGNEALRCAIKQGDIGLIILDVQMPEMDGFEVASILQSNSSTKQISIIFVTAINKEEHYVMRGYADGAVDYLSKPLDIKLAQAKVNVFERMYFYQKNLKLALEEKKEINNQLERFMYVVAHDLKSPLAGLISILGMMEYALDDDDQETLRSYLHLGEVSANKLNQMISSILNYSKNAHNFQEKELVSVKDLLSDIKAALFLPEKVQVSVIEPLPCFYTNAVQLYQVFQNLISNAIKHNDKERVQVEAGMSREDEDFYTFYVKDNGSGIAQKDYAKVFGLFQTVDQVDGDTKDNTGIGLNLVKMFVEKQGGTVDVVSELGTGSTFYFKWRRAKPE
ncbi:MULTISPECIES: hybrid sensor histidine kinase/response regulator [Olivibacter]|uniref:histidine kinase n=1 Tax=Olivibacter oleidegradans TaxID=760123 RepID=A0ABV6HMR0_9SPHI|nr:MULTISPECIES: hybrid sensor histidine kinase/response regulator [Olivibacter]MDX3915438.1 hybrid sensor histidine kinase/response regulator [Pseudosphingobacterium sp.]QEL02917.1 hybrid sensor histidine kinase/response regulator [Olivibacter sp. LS-1]